ncbi:MAG: alpha/beta fold hydrolase [Candidatus Dormibacteraeota bacterium]|uniref:Alpha/beta fold hydrolase n=1 Tax=Candidatus Aeolococcus gillhamiae TaxID=3127015 RepID=A0A2W5ZA05_9BACT|nr:alpha/beta fold hydrolase [Candidatus Dormibacteraeota bacterium]PZR82229.1 MAG: alpha/beta hydrolase [Candidatus Dormibacter sp. RRmetagenome_bin12]
MSQSVRHGSFHSRGQRLAYTMHGSGDRPVILLPGLLLPARMNTPLAEHLAERGHRVILLDPLGQGDSARPRDMWRYSMTQFARDVVALLDHLKLEQAVVGGTSLGANITLEVASIAPKRLRAMVLEMPVLDNALVGSAVAFSPLLVAVTIGEPVMRLVSRLARLIPSSVVPFNLGIVLDTLRQDPGPSGALLQGLFFGRTAPHREERRTFTAPALVIGHHRDPVHPFSDAGMLAKELPNGRLVEASSILEMRLRPERLYGEIDTFLEQVWGPRMRVVRQSRGAPRAPATRRAAARRRSSARSSGSRRARS